MLSDPLSDQIAEFLCQEGELYGNTIYSDDDARPAAVSSASADGEKDHGMKAAASGGNSQPERKIAAAETPALFTSAEPLAAGYMRVHEEWTNAASLDALNRMICTCTKCALGATRTKFVFGVGDPRATLMIIGEAPGADEDRQGEPFVGRAGQLLNKILEAIQFKREEVFICNILKCRPPGNRDPLPSEEDECVPYLYKQIELVQPKIILALGRIAANRLLQKNLSMRELRAHPHEFHGIPLFATYHPAALLRNPNWKRETWEDVQKVRKKWEECMNPEV